mgnify:CR=1 FL=1
MRLPRTTMVKEICAHHWMIEAANGKKSSGICKHCGTSKEFFNSYDIPDINTAYHKPQLVTYAQRMWKRKHYGFDRSLG